MQRRFVRLATRMLAREMRRSVRLHRHRREEAEAALPGMIAVLQSWTDRTGAGWGPGAPLETHADIEIHLPSEGGTQVLADVRLWLAPHRWLGPRAPRLLVPPPVPPADEIERSRVLAENASDEFERDLDLAVHEMLVRQRDASSDPPTLVVVDEPPSGWLYQVGLSSRSETSQVLLRESLVLAEWVARFPTPPEADLFLPGQVAI